MNPRSSTLNPEEIELIYDSIEDFIQENHRLCYIKDIELKSGLPKAKCKKIMDFLIKNERMMIVFQLQKNATIYMPKYMFEGILQLQHKPKWLKKYGFKEKYSTLEEIEKLKTSLNDFEIIERLLYGTDKPLEESVAYCLNLIGLEDVVLVNDSNKHDVSFIHNGIKYILEVKGLTKHGIKENISQLDSWIQQELVITPNTNELKGVFVLNHFRNKDPNKRDDPLTPNAKKFLKYYRFKFFTTKFLFDLIKEVKLNKLNKEEAIAKIIEGEKYE